METLLYDQNVELTTVKTMKALVYHGPRQKSWEDKPVPTIKAPTDAVVKIFKTTICGTDLHIMKGDVPEVTDGRIIGHEGVGVIEEVGSAVSNFKKGDHVLISCITSCGKCDYCKKGMYSHCSDGGWILGHLIDGTQAEFVRIPQADNSLYPIPAGADEEALVMLSDILPTGFECGVLNGQVKPGDTVAIVGSGPIGLAALLTAQCCQYRGTRQKRDAAPGNLVVTKYNDHYQAGGYGNHADVVENGALEKDTT
jgi:alcohol dehydrogenase